MNSEFERLRKSMDAVAMPKGLLESRTALQQMQQMQHSIEQLTGSSTYKRIAEQTEAMRKHHAQFVVTDANLDRLQAAAAFFSPSVARFAEFDWYRSIFTASSTVSKLLAPENSESPLNRWHAISKLISSSGVLENSAWAEVHKSILTAASAIDNETTRLAVEEASTDASRAVEEADGTADFGLSNFSKMLFQRVDPIQALSLLMMVIFFYYTPYWDFQVKDKIAKLGAIEDRRELAKEIAREMSKLDLHPAYTANRRIASRSLIAHQNGRALSPEIGRIRMGEVVVLIDFTDNWAKVVWKDASGREMAGWVHARYLTKLK